MRHPLTVRAWGLVGRVDETDREALHAFFRARIEEAKRSDTAASWDEQLGEVLNYTAWHRFTLVGRSCHRAGPARARRLDRVVPGHRPGRWLTGTDPKPAADALTVLAELPARAEPLPVFAARVLKGDSHALDDGTRTGDAPVQMAIDGAVGHRLARVWSGSCFRLSVWDVLPREPRGRVR